MKQVDCTTETSEEFGPPCCCNACVFAVVYVAWGQSHCKRLINNDFGDVI